MGESMKHSVVWQMLLPIPIVSGIAIAAAAYFVPPLIASDAVESALTEAQRTVSQFRTLRGYYTKAVVAKVTKGSSLKAGFDHQDKADAIPLPATMIQDLSALLQQQGTSIRLYSPYPFPNRGARRLDDFGTSAWEALSRNPDSIFSRRALRVLSRSSRETTARRRLRRGRAGSLPKLHRDGNPVQAGRNHEGIGGGVAPANHFSQD